MASDELRRKVEELCEWIVLADLDCVSALMDIEASFAEFPGLFDRGPERTAVVAISRAAECAIAHVLPERATSRETLLEVLGAAASSLRALIDDAQDPDAVCFDLDRTLAALGEEAVTVPVAATRESDEPPAPSPPMRLSDDDADLHVEFVSEGFEHVESVEVELLALERGDATDDSINAIFRGFHTIKGVAAHLELADITELAHEAETLLDLVRSGERPMDDAAISAVFESGDAMKRLLGELSRAAASDRLLRGDVQLPGTLARLRELSNPTAVTARGESKARSGADAPPTRPAEVPTPLPASSVAPASPVDDEKHTTRVTENFGREFLRIDADRMDALFECIGEMVTSVSVLERTLATDRIVSRENAFKEMTKTVRALQEIGTSLRMVSLRSTFFKMNRVVRDAARELEKKVAMTTYGESTELDKAIVDRLADPLLHLLRNAVDHGIESRAERVAAGKPEVGRIDLRAFHLGASVYIQIDDDGRGLDRETILRRARETGLVRDEDELSDRDVYALIFEPGFSTADKVTSVSGRGVGMDIVRRNLEEVSGAVEVSSRPGRGTSFSIRLPLTIAIIDGMIVVAGKEEYILPTLSIVRSVRPRAEDISTVAGRDEFLMLKDRMLPLYRLSEALSIPTAFQDPEDGIVVILECEDRKVGLLVDRLAGQQQLVIKNLGKALRNLRGIAGGAILGDGHVALILDVAGLVKLAEEQRAELVEVGALADRPEETSVETTEQS